MIWILKDDSKMQEWERREIQKRSENKQDFGHGGHASG